jgi:hypothetical protein
MSYHAKLSPSSAKRWVDCTASVDAQEGLRDDGSDAARLGTTGHQLSAECLEYNREPQSYLGYKMGFHAGGENWTIALADSVEILHTVTVDQEMIDACVSYVDHVHQQVELSGAELHVEQRVPIGHITGEDGAGGTSDVVMTSDTVLTSIDLKLGRGKVMAYDVLAPAGVDVLTAEPTPEVVRINLQLAFYLLGAMKKYPGDYTHVKAVIVQPYLNHISEYSCSVDELLAVGAWLKSRAEATRTDKVFAPSEDSCHFCKARFTCAAREHAVLSTALIGFEDVDQAQPAPMPRNKLGSLYDSVGMIQSWCKDVISHTFAELQSGKQVMRNDGLQYKLVTGKKGNRKFDDADEAEALMKSLRLNSDQMYTRSLISPASAEKLSQPTKQGKEITAPPVLSPRQWAKLESRITQSAGSPTIALETDPRPEIESAVAGFDDVVPAAAENCDDLFS